MRIDLRYHTIGMRSLTVPDRIDKNLPDMQPPTKRIPSLDGLRAISIMMVIVAHSLSTNGFPEKLGRRIAMFVSGALGVHIFFVISGFLITTLLLREEAKTGRISVGAFYARRSFRIWPVYYLYIIAIFIIDRFTNNFAVPNSAYFSAATFTTRLWGEWGPHSWILLHSWSLSVEEQFYLLWPLTLVLVAPALGRRRFIVGSIIVLAPFVRLMFYYFGDVKLCEQIFPTQADAIMFGCLLALALNRNQPFMQKIFYFHPHFFRTAAVVIIHCPYFVLPKAGFIALNTSITGFAIAYLIGSLVTVRAGMSYQVLNHPALRWIGILSYSLYIWQSLALYPSDLETSFWFQRFPQNLGLVFGFAVISFFCVEKPFLTMKDRFSKLDRTAAE